MFKSRVRVSLRYPAINLEATTGIWKKIMRQPKADYVRAEIKVGFDTNEPGMKPPPDLYAFQMALALGHDGRRARLWAAARKGKRGGDKWMMIKLTTQNVGAAAEATSPATPRSVTTTTVPTPCLRARTKALLRC